MDGDGGHDGHDGGHGHGHGHADASLGLGHDGHGHGHGHHGIADLVGAALTHDSLSHDHHSGGHTGHSHGGSAHGVHGGAHGADLAGPHVDKKRTREIIPLDGDAITESLLLSYDHCSVYPPGSDCRVGGYNIVDANEGGFPRDRTRDGKERAGARPLTPEQIEIVRRIADDPGRRSFGVHVVNHGGVDLQAIFAELAKALNCKRIDNCTPNFFGSNTTLYEITDWNRYTPPFLRNRVPAGYYDGCTGTTHVWKQIWQVGKKWKWWENDRIELRLKTRRMPSRPQDRFNHPPDRHYNRDDNTTIEVFGVTWFYRESGDFETRFQVSVISAPELDPADLQFGYRKEPFQRHQHAARLLIEQMLNKLKEAVPHPAAVKLRGAIVAREEGERAVVQEHKVPIITPAQNADGEPRIIIQTPTPKSAADTGGGTGSGIPKPPFVTKMAAEKRNPTAANAGSVVAETVVNPGSIPEKVVITNSAEPSDYAGVECETVSGADLFTALGKDGKDEK